MLKATRDGKYRRLTALVCLLLGLALNTAVAQVDAGYKGVTIRLVTGYNPPSVFDTYARVLAEHMGRHIPGNPNIIVQNMPGAGGLTATRWLTQAAPKDGTVIALPNPANVIEPLLNPEAAKFDTAGLIWIGSMNSEISTCGFWNERVRDLQELRSRSVVVGSTGPSSGSTIDVLILKDLLKLDMRIISGYQSLAEMRLASEKKELDGHCGITVTTLKSAMGDAFKSGAVRVPIQMGLHKHPDLPDVPNAFDLVQGEADKQLLKLMFGPWYFGRPIAAPSSIPPARLAALRAAFDATMKDHAFLTSGKARSLEINAVSGTEVEDLAKQIYETPQPTIERARKILGIK